MLLLALEDEDTLLLLPRVVGVGRSELAVLCHHNGKEERAGADVGAAEAEVACSVRSYIGGARFLHLTAVEEEGVVLCYGSCSG